MPIPDFQSLMLPTLKALAVPSLHGKGTLSSEIRDRVAAAENLTPEDLNEMVPSGRQLLFPNRISWALIYMNKAGLVERMQRGVYQVTEAGRELLATNPERIDANLLDKYPGFTAWAKWRGRKAAEGRRTKDERSLQPESESEGTPEERLINAHQELRNMLEIEMLEKIREARPGFLEKVVIDLLIKMGYGDGDPSRGTVTPIARDGGIDGTIKDDALGLEKIHTQTKRYDEGNNIGSADIDGFVGALDKKHMNKGVFVTTSSFTKGAQDVAGSSRKRIILIDGKELARLMVKYDVGVRIKFLGDARDEIKIKELDEEYFDEERL